MLTAAYVELMFWILDWVPVLAGRISVPLVQNDASDSYSRLIGCPNPNANVHCTYSLDVSSSHRGRAPANSHACIGRIPILGFERFTHDHWISRLCRILMGVSQRDVSPES